MSERIVQTNLGSVVELTQSSNGNFQQLFIAHAISIQEFAMRCQLMSQKLIEFLVHFSDFIYNVIACFYAELCIIYQIYILQKFKA